MNSWKIPTFAAVALLAIGSLLWWIPRVQVQNFSIPPVDPSGENMAFEVKKLENEYRKTLAQILFGLGVFLSLYVGYRRVLASEESQITERFTNAIDHVSDTTTPKVLGGIHALGRIARDSEKDRWTVVEILAALVRDKYPVDPGDDAKGALPLIIAQTILSIIGTSHSAKDDRHGRRLNLQEIDIPGVDLDGAYLKDANFKDSRLAGCDLSNSNLENADFVNSDLAGVFFVGALLKNTNFDGANLRGANFLDARGLKQAQIDKARIDDTTRLPDELNYYFSVLDTTTD